MRKKILIGSIFKILSILLIGLAVISCGGTKKDDNTESSSIKNTNKKNYSFEVSDEDFRNVYSNFKSNIVLDTFEGDGKPATPPADVFSLIYYKADDGEMAAFLSPDPKDGKKHPAVIWLIGGYGGIGNDDYFWRDQAPENDQTGSAFRKAGIVMMIPSFRGENNNPGTYDMFHGEIKDLESAREYLASIPYVDPNRIYVVGHSTGGTRVLLGNEYSNGFRAAFSLGGIPDLELRIKYGKMRVDIPFDQKNPEEFKIRSPRTYIKSIKSPTFYFEGEDDFWPEFNEVQNIANDNNVPFKTYSIRGGDHFNIITPVTQMIAEKILNDTGEKTNIDFSKEDIKKIEGGI